MKRTFNLLVLLTLLPALAFSALGVNPVRAAGGWVTVGLAGFSAGVAWYTSLAMDDGTPYVAYQDFANSDKATVMKFNGLAWETVGSVGFSAGEAYFTSLVIENGTPYVAYMDQANSFKATVMKFNGATWETVGSAGFSAGAAGYTSLALHNGTPYVAFSDAANGSRVTLMKFNGVAWEIVGAPGFSTFLAGSISLALDNGTPYVAFEHSLSDQKATVMKFNGTSWETVGAEGFSAGIANYTSLVVENGTPYVAYQDFANSYKTTVMKFNGVSWETVGAAGFSAGNAYYLSLAMDNGIPYLAYQDETTPHKTTVMKFNGVSWETVGSPGFSAGDVDHVSLEVENGTPYVAYADGESSYKATVMKYDSTPSTITVESAEDDGTTNANHCPGVNCHLRDAIAAAYPGDIINFAGDYTIALVGALTVEKDLTINGAGRNVTLSGDTNGDGTADVQVIFITPGVNVVLNHLTITKGVSDSGGGIYNDHAELTVTNSILSDNIAYNSGGAIMVHTGTLTVTGSSFSNNSAVKGGSIAQYYGTSVVSDSIFSSNSATDNGGGVYNIGGTLTVTGSTFTGNTAYNGGGISNFTTDGPCASGSAVTVSNSTFSGNNATSGGGIFNDSGVITLLFDTIFDNLSGGGAWSRNNASTCIKVGSSILAGNTGYDLSAGSTTERFYSLDYNLVGVAGANVDFDLELNQPHDQVNVADPMLAALADNGGPTPTHALLGGSPAIDAGDDSACAAPPINGKDQRGVTRPKNAHCDIGSYELDNSAPTDIALSASSVGENLPIGATVGTLTATDPDPGDTHTFALFACGLPGPDDANFSINGSQLKTNAVFDYEVQNSYNICIRANDGKGGSFDKNFTINVLDKVDVPAGVVASNGFFTTKVQVIWIADSVATTYKVYRASSAGGTKSLIANLPDTAFDDITAVPGVVYYYWVKACSGVNCSNYSAYDAGWRNLTEPTGVLASDGAFTDKVLISWNASAGATSYRVYRATSPTGAKSGPATTTATSINDTSATPGVTYYYFVKACKGANCSGYSDNDTGWRNIAPPTNLQASDGTYPDKVQLTWTASLGATSYKIYRATSATGTKTLLGSITGTTANDTSANPGVTYYYWVKACRGSKSSVFSTYDTGRR